MNTGNNKHLEAFKNMHLLHPLLHLRFTVLTLVITVLMHPYSMAFCPVFVLWHFVRV